MLRGKQDNPKPLPARYRTLSEDKGGTRQKKHHANEALKRRLTKRRIELPANEQANRGDRQQRQQ